MTKETRIVKALYEVGSNDAKLIIQYAVNFILDGSKAAKQAFDNIEKMIADPEISIRQISQYALSAALAIEHGNQ